MSESPLDGAVTIIQLKHDPNPVMKEDGLEHFPMLESFFRIEQPTAKQREQLKQVQEFLSKEGEDEMKQLSVLKDIRFRLAEGDLFSVHKYIKLRGLAKSYETEAKALENV